MTKNPFILAVSAMVLAGAADASALTINPDSRIAQLKNEVKTVRQFRGIVPWGMSDTNEAYSNRNKVAVKNPSTTFKGLSTYDFLEAPDGSTWFYTAEYDIESVEISEYYTEEYIKGYIFTIYDEEFKELGKIKDKISLQPGETKVVIAQLDPAVSANFFNNDSNFEFMVYLAMNTGPEFGYEVHYYNKVYSLNGEKDSEGNDVSIGTMPGRCADTLNAGKNGEEDFYFTFVDDVYPDPSDYDFNDYLSYINDAKTVVSVYKKSENGEGPTLAFEKDIYMTRYPGDTTEGIYMISRNEDGVPYFIFSQYEKPYFLDPTGFATDESATPDNNLVIEVVTYENGKLNDISTTKIPVEILSADGTVAYAFYSIGSVAWKDDIDMSVNGSRQAPAFLVARDVTTAANLDDVTSGYFIYDNSGKEIVTLSTEANGIILMNSIAGKEPQALFVAMGDEGDYTFNFIDLHSGKKAMTIPQIFNEESLSAVCQRIPSGDGYHYAFEMTYDDTDEAGNDIKRIAWIDPKDASKFERIDYLNMGKGIMASSVNMFEGCLSPYLYDTDDAMEYAVLVKRVDGETTKNEFLVIDDNGEWYAHFSEADGKGVPMSFTVFPNEKQSSLMMAYRDEDNTVTADIYLLPFFSDNQEDAGVDSIIDNGKGDIAFDGQSVIAPGSEIEVYNLTGMKVANGKDVVKVSDLSAGTYIAVAKNTKENPKSIKIIIR